MIFQLLAEVKENLFGDFYTSFPRVITSAGNKARDFEYSPDFHTFGKQFETGMKKLLAATIFLLTAVSAGAQLRLGGSFRINYSKTNTEFSDGGFLSRENEFVVTLNPKVYWNINEKMQVGGRVGFSFGNMFTGYVCDFPDAPSKELEPAVNKGIGWSVSPFFAYRLLQWKFVSIYLEANAAIGQYYNIGEKTLFTDEWSKSTEYGFQLLPVANIDITESLALQLHLGILSLGWYGSTSEYPGKTVHDSVWSIQKGGLDGLIQGFYSYGIGIVKKF